MNGGMGSNMSNRIVLSHHHFQIQDEFDSEMISVQNVRAKQLKEYCAKHAKDSSEKDLDLSHIIVLESYKLVYCPIPKVASTVWKKLLLNAEGHTIKGLIHRDSHDKMNSLRQYSLEERKKILKKYKKFMFVRNPFERLLSAYKDCFRGNWKRNDSWWKKLRYGIREFLMENGNRRIKPSADNTTFGEFLNYLIVKWKQSGSADFNEHWRPQFSHCHPCDIQYDFIGHYETLYDDALFLLRKTKLQDKVAFPQWKATNTSARMRHYYSGVSRLRLSQLKEIYKQDIEAFVYTYNS